MVKFDRERARMAANLVSDPPVTAEAGCLNNAVRLNGLAVIIIAIWNISMERP